MKYIVTKTEDGKRDIFLFPSTINHDAMAEALYGIKNQTHGDWERIRRKPVSAGFIEGGKCCGRSESLRLESHAGDTELLTRA